MKCYITVILNDYTEVINELHYNLQSAIDACKWYINDFIKEYELYDEISKYNIQILCDNTNPNLQESDELTDYIKKIAYNEYIRTNNLFKSLLTISPAILIFNEKCEMIDTRWQKYDIEYIPSLTEDITEYKYKPGDVVKYINDLYIIEAYNTDFTAESLLNNSYRFYHSYRMHGIKTIEQSYEYIRLDDPINTDLLTTDFDYNDEMYNFTKELINVVDSSLDKDKFVNTDLIMLKYWYYKATGKIKLDLQDWGG